MKASIAEPLKAPAKEVYGQALSMVLRGRGDRIDPERSVFVLGSPRSGTTLLMEVAAALPGACPIFEPLNTRQDWRLRQFLREDWPRLGRADSFPELQRFLADVVRGHHVTRWSSAHASFRQLAGAERLVVKFVRAQRAAGWLATTFPQVRKVIILRHPCAVVSSMMKSPGIWHAWPHPHILDPIRAQLGPQSNGALARIESRAGLFAAFWAADARLMLNETSPDEALVLTYESLIRRPDQTLAELFDHLDEPIPAAARARLGRPSRTANAGSAIRTGKDPLASWCGQLSGREADEILEVARGLGVSFYSRDLEPDAADLAAFPRWRKADGAG